MLRRPALHTRIPRRLVGLAELLLLLLPACSQLPIGEEEAFGVVENSGDERPSLPPAVRVMSWNVHGGAAARDTGHLRALAKVIRASKADVVLLQEVHRGTDRRRWTGPVRRAGGDDGLERLLRQELRPGRRRLRQRDPVSRAAALGAHGAPAGVGRAAHHAAVREPVGRDRGAAPDHPPHRVGHRQSRAAWRPGRLDRRSPRGRRRSAHHPGGDFNAPQLAPEMLPLRDRSPVRSAAKSRLVTYRSTGRSYDHVFVGAGWSASDASIVRDGPSDHWPVSTTLRRVDHRAEASG